MHAKNKMQPVQIKLLPDENFLHHGKIQLPYFAWADKKGSWNRQFTTQILKKRTSDIFFYVEQQKQRSKIALFDIFPLFDISFLVCSSISVAYREPLGRPLGRLWVTMLTLILHNRSCLLLLQSFWLKSLICADVADIICFSYKFWSGS